MPPIEFDHLWQPGSPGGWPTIPHNGTLLSFDTPEQPGLSEALTFDQLEEVLLHEPHEPQRSTAS